MRGSSRGRGGVLGALFDGVDGLREGGFRIVDGGDEVGRGEGLSRCGGGDEAARSAELGGVGGYGGTEAALRWRWTCDHHRFRKPIQIQPSDGQRQSSPARAYVARPSSFVPSTPPLLRPSPRLCLMSRPYTGPTARSSESH